MSRKLPSPAVIPHIPLADQFYLFWVMKSETLNVSAQNATLGAVFVGQVTFLASGV